MALTSEPCGRKDDKAKMVVTEVVDVLVEEKAVKETRSARVMLRLAQMVLLLKG